MIVLENRIWGITQTSVALEKPTTSGLSKYQINTHGSCSLQRIALAKPINPLLNPQDGSIRALKRQRKKKTT